MMYAADEAFFWLEEEGGLCLSIRRSVAPQHKHKLRRASPLYTSSLPTSWRNSSYKSRIHDKLESIKYGFLF